MALKIPDLWEEYRNFMFPGKKSSNARDYSSGDIASDNGYLSLLKLKASGKYGGGLSFSSMAMNNAAKSGHLHVVKYLHETRTEGCTTLAMDYAAKNGHFNIVKWLHKNRKEGCTTSAMNCAAGNGDLDMLKLLRENRKEDPNALLYSSANGHLKIIQWLYQNKIKDSYLVAFTRASYFGHLHIVKFLFTEEIECRTARIVKDAKSMAKFNGHHDVFQWLDQLKYSTWKREYEIPVSNYDAKLNI